MGMRVLEWGWSSGNGGTGMGWSSGNGNEGTGMGME